MLEDSRIQYLQTGYWNKEGEAAIAFTDSQLDWSLNTPELQSLISASIGAGRLSEKDQQGLSLKEWVNHPLSQHYLS